MLGGRGKLSGSGKYVLLSNWVFNSKYGTYDISDKKRLPLLVYDYENFLVN